MKCRYVVFEDLPYEDDLLHCSYMREKARLFKDIKDARKYAEEMARYQDNVCIAELRPFLKFEHKITAVEDK